MSRNIVAIALIAPFLVAADIETAQGLLVQGDFVAAQREFQQITEDTPSLPAGWIGLARSYAGLGRCQEAVQTFADWRHASGYNARAASAEAWCWYRLGEYAQAWESAGDAHLLKPNLGPALYLRALSESAMDERDAFDDTLAELYPGPRGDVLTVLAAGWDAVEHGDDLALMEALDEMEHLRHAYPQSGVQVQSALMEAQRRLDLGDAYGAEEVLSQIGNGGSDQIRAVFMRAEALRRLGKTGAARRLLSQPNLKSRTASMPRSVRARVLVDLGLLDAVVERLDELKASSHPDDLASGWYVARALGDESLMDDFSVRWRAMNANPDRKLMDLVPVALEPE